MLEVLIYLFENYMLGDAEYRPDAETLAVELSQAGFERDEIDKAFDWLERLASLSEQSEVRPAAAHSSLRHYTLPEQSRIDATARGLLLSLERFGVLTPDTREMVIDRIMALDDDDIDLDDIKWVITVVLSNAPDATGLGGHLDEWVVEGAAPYLH